MYRKCAFSFAVETQRLFLVTTSRTGSSYVRRPRKVFLNEDEEINYRKNANKTRNLNHSKNHGVFTGGRQQQALDFDDLMESSYNTNQGSSYSDANKNNNMAPSSLPKKSDAHPLERISEFRSFNKKFKAKKIEQKKKQDSEIYITKQEIEWRFLPENDKTFLDLMSNMKNRKKREEMNKILLEGRRLIAEALLAGVKLHSLYFTNENDLDKLPLVKNEGELYKISLSKMHAWSDLETPPGIFAIMEKPNVSLIKKRQSNDILPVTVILDNLRDPGNMGSVIRALAASGCQKIVALKGCCDIWESKVLRGGMGSHFTIPIYDKVQWEYLRNYLPADFDVFLADSNSYQIMCQAESYKKDYFDDEVVIDNNNNIINQQESDLVVDNQIKNEEAKLKTATFETNEFGEKILVDKDLKRPNSKYSVVRLAVLEHFKIDFAHSDHVALIIGGETQGASIHAYHFVHKHQGIRCHIPMVNNVESLNVATAASIIAFEIRRQLARKFVTNDSNESAGSFFSKQFG